MTTIDDPIRFAERLLALLEEGSFTATYKFAVLLGLMDLCLEHSNRFGEPAPMVTTRQLAEKVIDLYWSHTTPFESHDGEVLKQNSGKPAVILSRIQTLQKRLRTGSWLHPPPGTAHQPIRVPDSARRSRMDPRAHAAAQAAAVRRNR